MPPQTEPRPQSPCPWGHSPGWGPCQGAATTSSVAGGWPLRAALGMADLSPPTQTLPPGLPARRSPTSRFGADQRLPQPRWEPPAVLEPERRVQESAVALGRRWCVLPVAAACSEQLTPNTLRRGTSVVGGDALRGDFMVAVAHFGLRRALGLFCLVFLFACLF